MTLISIDNRNCTTEYAHIVLLSEDPGKLVFLNRLRDGGIGFASSKRGMHVEDWIGSKPNFFL